MSNPYPARDLQIAAFDAALKQFSRAKRNANSANSQVDDVIADFQGSKTVLQDVVAAIDDDQDLRSADAAKLISEIDQVLNIYEPVGDAFKAVLAAASAQPAGASAADRMAAIKTAVAAM